MSFILNLLLLSLVYFAPTSHALGDENFNTWKDSLTDEQKISQLFITGIRGKSLTKDQELLLKRWPLAGVIYFKRNFKSASQFKVLNNQVVSILGKDSFSFADQEGGSVIRIGSQYDSPTALSVGKLANRRVTNYLGEAYGALLKDLNISNNLAPVVDIKDKLETDFISNRSFGSDPRLVADLSLEFSKGLLKSGTIPTLKHFPGLGSIKYDTHKKTPLKISTLKDLKTKDWLPYSRHSKSKIPFFVMSSHTELVIDGKNLGVVTYSKESLNHLRSITSKNQLVITDDLEMKGAKIPNKSFEMAAYDSFMAGHDLLLVGWPGRKLKKTLAFFKTKLKKDMLFKKRLNTTLARVYRMRRINEDLKTRRPLFNAKASLKLSSTLNSNITNYLVKKEKTVGSIRLPAQEGFNKTLVFSSDPVFKRFFNSKLKTYSLLRTENNDIYQRCLKNSCILHLTGQKTSKKIMNLLSSYKGVDFTIVNSVDPNLISSENRKKHRVFDVLTRSYDLGKQIYELLKRENKAQAEKKSPEIKRIKYQKVVSLPQRN